MAKPLIELVGQGRQPIDVSDRNPKVVLMRSVLKYAGCEQTCDSSCEGGGSDYGGGCDRSGGCDNEK